MTINLWIMTQIMKFLIATKYPDFNNAWHMKARLMEEEDMMGMTVRQLRTKAKKMGIILKEQ